MTSRCFTALFALTGVTLLGIVLGHMGSAILEAQEAAIAMAQKDHAVALQRLFNASGSISQDVTPTTSTREPSSSSIQPELSSINRNTSTSSSSGSHLLWGFAACVVVLVVFGTVLSDDPGVSSHGWGGALYYAIITATTVGYGDMAPTSQRGRLVAVIFIPIAVAVMGHWISSVATYIMEQRQLDQFQRQLLERDLCLSDLDHMDENGDGQVTELEFMRFMLMAMNKVDASTWDSLQEYFERLDVDRTGTLSRNDIITNAKTKLRQIHRKLELASYKKRLIIMGQGQSRSSWMRIWKAP
jgi:potassium channel subfamily K, other eukaryote